MPGVGNPNELGVALERGDVRGAAVTHPGSNSANQLVNDHRDAALMRHAPFDAFGHELFRCAFAGGTRPALELEVVLEVAIAAAFAHGANRPHAPILLERAALIQDQLTGTFVGASEQVAR